jgi:hypothetical protein
MHSNNQYLKVRYGKDANPTEVKSDIKRIAHKKQRPPEMR